MPWRPSTPEEIPKDMSLPVALGWLLVGLILLMASARMLVWSAVELAQIFGVSDLVIGLTVVAIGTSLPELAASGRRGAQGRARHCHWQCDRFKPI